MAVAGWRRFYYKYLYFYFFLWRCVTHHWGRVWGVNLFQTKWFIFLFFIFFMAVVAPHWGRVAWVKLNAPAGGLFFLLLFFFTGGGGVVAEKIWGGVEGKAKGRKKPRGQITCDDVVRKV